MNIILTGFRGTGKTTVGKMLARKLKRPFYDTDIIVQEEAGRTIKEIVAQGGWSTFRQMEKKAVAVVSLHDDCVIALGGGAILEEENVLRLRANGFFVWLTAEVKTILGRLSRDKESEKIRPSLTGAKMDEETLVLLNERIPYYEQVAHLIINTDGKSPEEVVAEIISRMNLTLGGQRC